MKSRIFLQFIVILIFLLVGNFLVIGKQYQARITANELNEVPILIYSRLYDDLLDLKVKLEQLDYVQRVEVQQDSTLAEELIEVYKLESALEVLHNYKLPSAGQIYVKGIEFDRDKYQQIQNKIFETYKGISINYREDLLVRLEQQLLLLEKIFFILIGVLALVAVIILAFLRVHFENKHNHYWKVFAQAGGDPYKREKLFWSNSITLIFFPMLLICGAYFGLRYKGLLHYEIELIYFGIELGILLFITLLSRIILGKRI